MSINLNELVDSLIQSAPPAELKQVSQSLSSLTKGTSTSSTNSLIQDSIEQYAQENIISIDNIIISKYNKDENSSKYMIGKIKRLLMLNHITTTTIKGAVIMMN